MEFTDEEKKVLRLLLKKELKDMEEDKTALSQPDTPFFSSMIKKSDGLAFIKSEEEYMDFLRNMIRRLD